MALAPNSCGNPGNGAGKYEGKGRFFLIIQDAKKRLGIMEKQGMSAAQARVSERNDPSAIIEAKVSWLSKL